MRWEMARLDLTRNGLQRGPLLVSGAACLPGGARDEGRSLVRVVLDQWLGLELAWAVSGPSKSHPHTRHGESRGAAMSKSRAWLA